MSFYHNLLFPSPSPSPSRDARSRLPGLSNGEWTALSSTSWASEPIDLDIANKRIPTVSARFSSPVSFFPWLLWWSWWWWLSLLVLQILLLWLLWLVLLVLWVPLAPLVLWVPLVPLAPLVLWVPLAMLSWSDKSASSSSPLTESTLGWGLVNFPSFCNAILTLGTASLARCTFGCRPVSVDLGLI